MQKVEKQPPGIAFHDQRSPLGIGSLPITTIRARRPSEERNSISSQKIEKI